MRALAWAMMVALRSLPVVSICRRRSSPFLFMAVTILTPLSSIAVLMVVNPAVSVPSTLSRVVLRTARLLWVFWSRSVMAPVFLLISTLMSFKPFSIAVVSALKRASRVEVWLLMAFIISLA